MGIEVDDYDDTVSVRVELCRSNEAAPFRFCCKVRGHAGECDQSGHAVGAEMAAQIASLRSLARELADWIADNADHTGGCEMAGVAIGVTAADSATASACTCAAARLVSAGRAAMESPWPRPTAPAKEGT